MEHRRLIHYVLDTVVGVAGAALSSLVIYLSVTHVRNRALRAYSIMLVSNAVVDLVYSLNTICTFASSAFGIQAVFMTVDNPFWPKTVFWTYAAISTNLFLMFLSVAMLPLQFVYRYGVMRAKPFSKKQMCGFFLISLYFATIHGFVSPFTFKPPGPEWEASFRQALDVNQDYVLPGYIVGDVRQFDRMAIHFIHIFVIVGGSYATILVMVWKSRGTVAFRDHDHLSMATRAVQRQVTRIIYAQSIYPLFIMCAPCLCFTIFSAQGIQVRMLGEYAMLSMHTPPLFNSMIVILCVPSYRRFFSRPAGADRVQHLNKKLLKAYYGTKVTISHISRPSLHTVHCQI
ncbi:unnamed protein product [Bursaphelenchus xylophilus]|uniref:(pine wood nematode) hypothetical protein n=1 Tax=Bursaphelenchus xylophilus TaxID=6326 RepID=A0A1I7RXR4_BURXY|nr:unnamed protein product [Bursaphelenchus xylophilus]CAG9126675.1 unnamed protein product [Bursaphelenchus xylophilus]